MAGGSDLLRALGLAGATVGGGAAVHGAGLGDIFTPLDAPRRALDNAIASPFRAMKTGDYSKLLGAIPGIAGGALAGSIGGPIGILAGSLLGGFGQILGESTGSEIFNAPSISEITGTEDFLPNFIVGSLTDPMTYAGLGGTWKAGKAALGAKALASPIEETAARAVAKQAIPEALPIAKMAEEAIPVAQIAPPIPDAKRIVEPFYSRLERAVERLPEEVDARTVYNRIKKFGVSDEEIEATNFMQALEGKKSTTRKELLKHFDDNKISVKEVTKLDPSESNDFLASLENDEFSKAGSDIANYQQYQTPGGMGYRELVLTLPKNKGVFQSAHWEEPNVLAHVRFNERMGKNGEKILHIEEIQSDWHQKGKKEGYRTPQLEAEQYRIGQEYHVMSEKYHAMPEGDAKQKAYAELMKFGNENLLNTSKLVSPAPFKENWHELAMKRMIRYAADNDYDAITLNTGTQINKVLGSGPTKLPGNVAFYGDKLGNDLPQRLLNGIKQMDVDDLSPTQLKVLRGEITPEAYAKKLVDDATLPNWIKKYGKQFGVTVEPAEIMGKMERHAIPGTLSSRLDYERTPVTRMSLPPALRESVLTRGQPLLGLGAGVGGSALLAALLGNQEG